MDNYLINILRFGSLNDIKSSINENNINIIDEDGNNMFYYVSSRNIEIIKFLLDLGVNINHCNERGEPMLFKIYSDNINTFKLLIDDERCDVNIEDSNNNIILFKCLRYSDDYNILLKLMYKCNPLHENKFNENALMMLSYGYENHFVKIIKFFIERGLNINDVNQSGESPLFYAISRSYELVKVLLSFKANPNLTDFKCNNALMYALINGSDETILYLLKYCTNNSRNFTGQTKLMLALKHKDNEIINHVMKHINDVNDLDDKERGYLYYSMNNIKYLKYFIDQGLDINKRDVNGDDLLCLMIKNKAKKECIDYLLSQENVNLDRVIFLLLNDIQKLRYIIGDRDFSIDLSYDFDESKINQECLVYLSSICENFYDFLQKYKDKLMKNDEIRYFIETNV